MPGGLVVFGLPSISGANQKKKSTLRPLRLERSPAGRDASTGGEINHKEGPWN